MGLWEGAGHQQQHPFVLSVMVDVMGSRGWWTSGHSWCLLPGLSSGFGAAGASLRLPQLSSSQAHCTRLMAPREAWWSPITAGLTEIRVVLSS